MKVVHQRENKDTNARLKDAQTKSTKEECAGDMAQRRNDAAVKDVQIKLTQEEFVGDTGQNALRMTNQLLRCLPYLDQISAELLHPSPISVLLMFHKNEVLVCLQK